ncbi:ABC-2 transporter permease [Zobellia galactanivorans]|uniref:ABC-2 transporter permease n=1 Tax=Zobellia galactanivorans (strain DSM 12802 / CCUG 47099 / CIP 106680 / NCIMB 13871 / Dsij) TaxID=63186 RepID=UPI001C075B1D|nr:ABC-2 transporter permease [Zobellia galactanivorans]MBU3025239.1 ABC-2 transporter permease [Zobellia galactanivorans]
MEELKSSFDRKITHKTYPTQRKKNAFLAGYLPFEIMETPLDFRKEYIGSKSKHNYILCDNTFLVRKESKYIGPIIFGAISIFLMISSLLIWYKEHFWDTSELVLFIISSLVLFSVIIYMITIPQKLLILNRKSSVITFSGVLWAKAITMPLQNIRLIYAGGAAGSPSPDRLNAIRPNKVGTFYTFHFGGNYFQELSFLIWYMDKNRPLPPGDAFDEYRKADYKRRKEEGFPPPIFRSFIPTREYKHKWQKERDKHWKDIIETDEKGNRVHRIWQSAENVERHGEWKPVVPQ